ncbi:MAG TPA: acetyl-CoA hydrolase/transferase C-terminal domain-containing protein [Acidimicrobiia bacterium]
MPIASMQAAVAAVRSRDRIAVPLGPGIPGTFLHALGARDDFEDLQVFGALLTDLYELFTRPGVRLLSGFYGPAERYLRDTGANVEFIPSDFRRFSPIVERFHPRVVAAAVSAPDADGWMSLSLHSGAAWYELRRVVADPQRFVVAESSPHFPRTAGLEPEFPHRLHVDEVDFVVETHAQPYALATADPSPIERTIAENVQPFIHSGSTLQIGIGGIPDMVVALLADGDAGDYGVHSEMFTTGLMRLHRAGKVTNARKGQFDGFSVTTFAAGTSELYEWLDGNDEVRFLPVDIVNSPETISRNVDMVTINGALAVDLWGQVTADSLNGRQFSGIGGHEDFVSVSGLELGDRAVICLPSTATVAGEVISRLVPALPEGMLVTTPRHQLDLVVTEHGVAHLRGRTVRERALALAAIAHPDFRADLERRARLLD